MRVCEAENAPLASTEIGAKSLRRETMDLAELVRSWRVVTLKSLLVVLALLVPVSSALANHHYRPPSPPPTQHRPPVINRPPVQQQQQILQQQRMRNAAQQRAAAREQLSFGAVDDKISKWDDFATLSEAELAVLFTEMKPDVDGLDRNAIKAQVAAGLEAQGAPPDVIRQTLAGFDGLLTALVNEVAGGLQSYPTDMAREFKQIYAANCCGEAQFIQALGAAETKVANAFRDDMAATLATRAPPAVAAMIAGQLGGGTTVITYAANDPTIQAARALVTNGGGGAGAPPAPVATNTGGGTPPAPVATNTGGGTPPAPVATNTGGGTPPAPVATNTGGGTPPAPVATNTGGGTPPAPVVTNTGGGGTPPAPVATNTGGGTNQIPLAPVATNPGGGNAVPNGGLLTPLPPLGQQGAGGGLTGQLPGGASSVGPSPIGENGSAAGDRGRVAEINERIVALGGQLGNSPANKDVIIAELRELVGEAQTLPNFETRPLIELFWADDASKLVLDYTEDGIDLAKVTVVGVACLGSGGAACAGVVAAEEGFKVIDPIAGAIGNAIDNYNDATNSGGAGGLETAIDSSVAGVVEQFYEETGKVLGGKLSNFGQTSKKIGEEIFKRIGKAIYSGDITPTPPSGDGSSYDASASFDNRAAGTSFTTNSGQVIQR
jgi:hypothetical protein